jgi:hypothetical protein
VVIRGVLVLVSAAMSGCVAWANPPLDISLGGGGVIHDFQGQPVSQPAPFQIEGSINPMQLFPTLRDRNFDAGAGFGVYAGKGAFAAGPYLEATYFLLHFTCGPDGCGSRLGIAAQGGVSFDDNHDPLGWRGSVRLSLEILSFASGAAAQARSGVISGGSASGIAAWGEGSGGLYIDGTYMDVGPHRIAMLGGGIMFRLPASAGFLVVSH